MFVNTLSQKTIEVLDSEARELLENAVTAAGTRFAFSILDGNDAETLSQRMRNAAAYLDRADSDDDDDRGFDPLSLTVFKSEDGESSYLKDQLSAFGDM